MNVFVLYHAAFVRAVRAPSSFSYVFVRFNHRQMKATIGPSANGRIYVTCVTTGPAINHLIPSRHFAPSHTLTSSHVRRYIFLLFCLLIATASLAASPNRPLATSRHSRLSLRSLAPISPLPLRHRSARIRQRRQRPRLSHSQSPLQRPTQ